MLPENFFFNKFLCFNVKRRNCVINKSTVDYKNSKLKEKKLMQSLKLIMM